MAKKKCWPSIETSGKWKTKVCVDMCIIKRFEGDYFIAYKGEYK